MLVSHPLSCDDSIRRELRNFHRMPEAQALAHLLPIANIGSRARSRAWSRARELVLAIRSEQAGKGGVDALLNEFSLSTEEGIVLMCLAEALLRVPDNFTMDRLIRDKLSDGDWQAHLGNSSSLFVNASAWGLLLTGKVVNYNHDDEREQANLLKKTLGRMGEPVIRASVRYAMQIMGTQFVLGTDIESALDRARREEDKGYRYSYDMLGEGARTQADAQRYFDSYLNAIEAIGKAANGRGPEASPGISVKLSAIHPRYHFSHRERVLQELTPKLKQLALAAKAHDIGFTVDAEEADRLELSMDVIEAVFGDPELTGWQGFGIAVQAYQKRGLTVIEWARSLSLRHQKRIMLRLVKGAYWDTEIKHAQVEGHSNYPVFTRKAATDVSYLACARRLLDYRDSLYPQFATHNAYTVASILEMDDNRSGYEFQRLHGMGDTLYDQVLQQDDVACRVYAPVGVHADLLAYLVRRLLENGANSSFVNNIIDESIPVESLLTDPVAQARQWQQAENPHIPLPEQLFQGQRRNAPGLDLNAPQALEELQSQLLQWQQQLPIDKPSGAEQSLTITNPADHNQVIGYADLDNETSMLAALSRCQKAIPAWQASEETQRAQLLEALADKLCEHRAQLMALCCKEAGKTFPDALAEVREAVDFCHYYAMQLRRSEFKTRGLAGLGTVLCISPWNFPLAIFLGQICAALAAGNTVIAKPAEQTSLIALFARELLAKAGFPAGLVEIVIARGPDAGAILVPNNSIRAVMFTGSTATATWLAQQLAQRADAPIPLIAETGGQNCMLVDSTALPEQVVDDVIASGFQSAGQRCSALRALFLQEEIADKVIAMIIGAMEQLHIGDPCLLSTDVGPVIDSKALDSLQQHVQRMDKSARLLYACVENNAGEHSFFAPRLYEISNLSLLEQEVFGPIVHVIRYRADQLDQVIEQVNATGFGLTFGVHSRIETLARKAINKVQAGNIYINRNMIGAVVGVQPFGGRGLSGTGPKAGGPAYLEALVSSPSTQHPQHELPPQAAGDTVLTVPPAQAQQAWAKLAITQRSSLLRRLIALLTDRALLPPHCLDHSIEQALQLCTAAEQMLTEPQTLPGPTGERNQLLLEPRGLLLVLLDDDTHCGDSFVQVIAALATGNSIIALLSGVDKAMWGDIASAMQELGFPDHVFTIKPIGKAASALHIHSLKGLMLNRHNHYCRAFAQSLAARKGPILPIFCSPEHNHRLLQWCCLEKTVSTDTTAAGGNASLMTMAVS